jgi:hypothetical protein
MSPNDVLPELKQNNILSGIDKGCLHNEQVIIILLTGDNVGVKDDK